MTQMDIGLGPTPSRWKAASSTSIRPVLLTGIQALLRVLLEQRGSTGRQA